MMPDSSRMKASSGLRSIIFSCLKFANLFLFLSDSFFETPARRYIYILLSFELSVRLPSADEASFFREHVWDLYTPRAYRRQSQDEKLHIFKYDLKNESGNGDKNEASGTS